MLIKKTNINKKKNVVPEKDFDFTNKKKNILKFKNKQKLCNFTLKIKIL